MFRSSALLLTSLILAACGSTTNDVTSAPPPAAAAADAGDTPDAGDSTGDLVDTDAGPVVDHGAPSTTYPAPHPVAPKVVSYGGSVDKAPKIVPIFFKNDALKAGLVDFASKIGASPYWKANTTEYGVGAVTSGPAVELTTAPPATITDKGVETFLQGLFDGTHPEFGTAPDPNTIYTIYFPLSTTITISGGGGLGGGSSTSCDAFGGYHDSTTVGTTPLVYAVVPECADFGGLTGIDVVTSTSSHEWLEAATDPHPTSDPAYASVDDDHIIWAYFLGGGEIGDMCAQDPDSFYKPTDLGYYVQRSWSNAAAKAGHDPCVPALENTVYFNSAPVLPDTLDMGGGSTKGVKIAVGDTKTIEVDLFSEADTGGPWTVKARSLDYSGTKTLDLSLDRDSGQNGEKLYLTIKALAKSQYGMSAFMISSRLNNRTTRWVGVVAN